MKKSGLNTLPKTMQRLMPNGKKNIKGKEEAFQRDKAQKNGHTGRHNTDNSLSTK